MPNAQAIRRSYRTRHIHNRPPVFYRDGQLYYPHSPSTVILDIGSIFDKVPAVLCATIFTYQVDVVFAPNTSERIMREVGLQLTSLINPAAS